MWNNAVVVVYTLLLSILSNLLISRSHESEVYYQLPQDFFGIPEKAKKGDTILYCYQKII